jgi:hypothetical protein
MVTRHLGNEIKKYLFKKKAVIIYGARQVGKTTLVKNLLEDQSGKILFLNGDDADIREALSKPNPSKIKLIIGNHRIVVVDEAQRIPEPGLVLKIIHDNYPEVQLIITGSSSFDLAAKINEPMTGRKFEFFLHTFSFSEMINHHSFLTEMRLLEHRMIFGYYPDIVLNQDDELKLLKTLTSSFLYKDLLNLEQVHKPVLLEKILKALALQIGNEVSYNELSKLLEYDKGTIEKYIDLLEKCYIIFKLPGLNRNVRNEIKKGRKIYFYDNGIRNAILGNFLPLSARSDAGPLWENFLISERHKMLHNNDIDYTSFFWRTTQQQEIDYIEERDGKMTAFEFKWKIGRNVRISKTFLNAYPGSGFNVITPENVAGFLLNEL